MGMNVSIEGSNPSFSVPPNAANASRYDAPSAEGWQSGRMRRSRKPFRAFGSDEGSNPSPSASAQPLGWERKERCPSGLRSATGNRVGAERCLAGSNPALSAPTRPAQRRSRPLRDLDGRLHAQLAVTGHGAIERVGALAERDDEVRRLPGLDQGGLLLRTGDLRPGDRKVVLDLADVLHGERDLA